MKISAIIIAKNAEKMIVDCIASVAFCDEVLVVDGGSTDTTATLAKKHGAHVVSGDATDFAKQRNIGLQAAKGEWVLYIDTDERVSKELQESISKAIGNDSMHSAYKIQRKNFYFGTHPWPTIELLERLFKKKQLAGWYGQLHESPTITGTIGMLEGFLLHFTHQDLKSMLTKTIVWSDIEAELRIKQHPRMTWWRFYRVMLTGFYGSYITQAGYQAGTAGLVESIYQAFSMFITYAKLWELQQANAIISSKRVASEA